ncbi:MAG: class I SAM-dependent methyltransferase [Gemmatimonadota bacterium]
MDEPAAPSALYGNYQLQFGQSNTCSPEEYRRYAAGYEPLYGPHLPADRGAAIADVGAGAGHFLYFLKERGYTQYEGVDLSPSQVEACRRLVTDQIQQGDAFAWLEERPGRFDAVVMNDLVEHIPHARVLHLLGLARTALREGGRLIVRTPNMASLLAGYSRHMDFTHVTGFTAESLRAALLAAGFATASVLPMPRHPTWKGRMRYRVHGCLVRLLYRLEDQRLSACIGHNLHMAADR